MIFFHNFDFTVSLSWTLELRLNYPFCYVPVIELFINDMSEININITPGFSTILVKREIFTSFSIISPSLLHNSLRVSMRRLRVRKKSIVVWHGFYP